MCGYLLLSYLVLILLLKFLFINYVFCLKILQCSTFDFLVAVVSLLPFVFVLPQGTVCDVREGKDVKALVDFARDKLKHIDIWVHSHPLPHQISARPLLFLFVLFYVQI